MIHRCKIKNSTLRTAARRHCKYQFRNLCQSVRSLNGRDTLVGGSERSPSCPGTRRNWWGVRSMYSWGPGRASPQRSSEASSSRSCRTASISSIRFSLISVGTNFPGRVRTDRIRRCQDLSLPLRGRGADRGREGGVKYFAEGTAGHTQRQVWPRCRSLRPRTTHVAGERIDLKAQDQACPAEVICILFNIFLYLPIAPDPQRDPGDARLSEAAVSLPFGATPAA